MSHELSLSGLELELILELLEGEQKVLLKEIRHTDTADFRAGLRHRLMTVEQLKRRTEALANAEQAAVGTQSQPLGALEGGTSPFNRK